MSELIANAQLQITTMLQAEVWSVWWTIGFLAGPILLTVASLVLNLYVANRHLGALVEALSNCRYVATRAGLCNQGWFERIFLLSLIGGMVQWPGPGLRSGEMDPEDLKKPSCSPAQTSKGATRFNLGNRGLDGTDLRTDKAALTA